MTLEEWRRRAGLSRFALAELAALHPATIWRIERNKRVPLLDTRRRICQALRIKRVDSVAWPEVQQMLQPVKH